MPQHSLTAQKGSILVGIIALSVVLTLGAGGMVLVAGMWNADRASVYDRVRLIIAAESGLHLGVRWARSMRDSATLSSFTSRTDITNGYVSLDGALVNVALDYDAVKNLRFLVSRASLTTTDEIIQVKWNIARVDSVRDVNGSLLPFITFGQWRDSIYQYNP